MSSLNFPSNYSNNVTHGWKTLKTWLNLHCGVDSTILLRSLQEDFKKLGTVRNHINFLRKCLKYGVIPKGFRLHFNNGDERTTKILTMTSEKIMKLTIKKNFKARDLLEINVREKEMQLNSQCPSYIMDQIKIFINKTYDSNFEATKATQICKFENLFATKLNQINKERIPHSKIQIQSLTNLSSHTLTEDEKNALSMGLNFAIPKKNLHHDIMDTIFNLEQRLYRIENLEEMKNDVRIRVSNIINSHPWEQKLNRDQLIVSRTIRNLKLNSQLHICKADKGNQTVIMNKEDYDKKVITMLKAFPYKKLSKDPTANYEKVIKSTTRQLVNENKLTYETFTSLTSNSSRCPKFYGSPKIHKPDVPLRPIVDFRGSPSYKIASHLNNILHPITNKGRFIVKNSEEFKSIFQNTVVKRGYCLVSFDVKSLYTKIPIQHTLEAMKTKLLTDTTWKQITKLEIQDIVMLMDTCMNGNYFEYERSFYEQLEGSAMGSPISPCFAEFLMQDLEEKLIPNMNCIQQYARFVDDIFAIVKRNEINNVLNSLNNYHSEIQFTFEVMEHNKLSFLDCMVEIKSDFTLGFSIYRKPTNTDKYLDFKSHHPVCHKVSVIDSLVNRALRICDEGTVEQELSHVTEVLQLNNYPKKLIIQRIDRMKERINNPNTITNNIQNQSDAYVRRLVIPYMGKLTNKIAQCIRHIADIETCYKPVNKISTILSNNKQKSNSSSGIYKLSCDDCPIIYVGGTGRDIKTRFKEHQSDIRAKKETSGPYSHIKNFPSHSFNQNGASLLEYENRKFPRKFKEALYILKSKDYNCNQEEGIKISPIWTALLLKNMKPP